MEFQGEISVTYTGGVFRPDHQVDVPEGARFKAMIRPASPDPIVAAKAMETIRRISDSGVFRSGGRMPTRDEMHERR
jgi:predicted DNA-binding antitoxin AbrB/MazE fold protein